jgi:hypothetical protein
MTNETKNLRLSIRCAVSSKPQAERTSLEEQERLGRELTATPGARVVRVCVIPGQSRDLRFGKTLIWPRP